MAIIWIEDALPELTEASVPEQVELPELGFQFFCVEHQYGWNTDVDGIDSGCFQCEGLCEGCAGYMCSCGDCHACNGDPCDSSRGIEPRSEFDDPMD